MRSDGRRPVSLRVVSAETILTEAVDAYRSALGERLLAAYALGSLAHGGFSASVSDIDLGLVLSDPISSRDARTIRAVADVQKARRSDLGERLSVFWGTPSTLRGESRGGRFPALDRLDLLENGRLLAGADARGGLPRPSANELLITGAEFALEYLAGAPRRGRSGWLKGWARLVLRRADAVQEIRCPATLLERGMRRVTKLVLFPVRFRFTAQTGHVGSNEAAVAHYLADRQAPAAALVAAALSWRTAPPTDEQAAADLLSDQILPLYLNYIDDHITRLSSLGQDELARAFTHWRVRLVR
jgi:predicted nucleotidyltransferase